MYKQVIEHDSKGKLMLSTIVEATQNFCIHQIRIPHNTHDDISKTRTLIAYIDIELQSGNKHRVYISADADFIQRVSKIFLEEDESDEETLIDMILETTNMIVGSAKVLAEDSQSPYCISTPFFEKIGEFDFEYDDIKVIQVENDKLTVAIKELN